MSTIVAVERGWISRDTAVWRLVQIADFLANADCFHGIYPHFMDGRTGKTIKFDRLDDGADIVETSYLLMGFLCAHGNISMLMYLSKLICVKGSLGCGIQPTGTGIPKEKRNYTGTGVPNNGFDMNFPIWGWNECLITYILAASSPFHPVSRDVYDDGWVGSAGFKNGKSYYGIRLPLGNYEAGGPLFFEHYTFIGIDPNGLMDSFGIDYFEQVRNHTLINRAYCIDNPKVTKVMVKTAGA